MEMQWVSFTVLLLLSWQTAAEAEPPCGSIHSCAGVEDTSLFQSLLTKTQLDSAVVQGNDQVSAHAAKDRIRREGPTHVGYDHAGVRVTDLHDYRDDAYSYLQEALRNLEPSARCNLPRMSLSEVQERWEEERAAVLRNAKDRPGDGYDEDVVEHELRADLPAMLRNNLPVLVQDVVRQLRWPAAHKWSQAQLTEALREKRWDMFTFNYPNWLQWMGNETLGEYLKSNENAHNIFLFAREWGKYTDKRVFDLVDVIRKDFTPHPSFAYPPQASEAIVAFDAIGSSHGFHFHDPVWQVQVEGYKMWHLLPPTVEMVPPPTPAGVAPSPENGWVPVDVDGKPFLHPNACAMLKRVAPPTQTVTCMVAPGEMVLLPDGWLHATCGLSNYTAAAGGWLGHTEPRWRPSLQA